MSCRATLEWLRSADLGALEEPPEEARRHLATCDACASALARTRAALALLRRWMDEAQPRVTADAAVALALSDERDGGIGRAANHADQRLADSQARRWRLAPLPLLALGLLLWLAWPFGTRPPGRSGGAGRAPDAPASASGTAPGSHPNAPGRPFGSGPSGTTDDGFAVEAPAGSRLAVFATENPKIRVVWLYEPTSPREGEPR